MKTPTHEMEVAKAWAKRRLASGSEPPWTYYRLMQLVDAIDSLVAGSAATHVKDNLYRIGPSDPPCDLPS